MTKIYVICLFATKDHGKAITIHEYEHENEHETLTQIYIYETCTQKQVPSNSPKRVRFDVTACPNVSTLGIHRNVSIVLNSIRFIQNFVNFSVMKNVSVITLVKSHPQFTRRGF